MIRFIFTIWIVVLFSSSVFAQSKKDQSIALFKNGQYEDVVSLLHKDRKLLRQNKELRFILGVAYFQMTRLNEAQMLLVQIIEKEKNPYAECWWYVGQILHTQQKFKEATDYYKAYLVQLRDHHPHRQMVIDAIRNCSNGLSLQYKAGIAEIDNLGKGVNTQWDEFAPVVSPNYGGKLYFSSIRPGNMGIKRNEQGLPDDLQGDYSSDIYSCELTNGRWSSTKAMDYLVNSADHDILLDFGVRGQTMYLFKGQTMGNGQILIDTFKQKNQRSITTSPFISPIRAETGDGMLFIFNDHNILFASNQLEGFGGYDLFRITKEQGEWGSPENLGPDINTQYDEITPFLARDGRTLYYSSNNSYHSIGGFDILKSVFIPEVDRWLPPQNLRAPINSPADDTHFRVNKDGTSAFLSSSRKDGLGKRDIYIAYFKNYLAEMEPQRKAPPNFAEVSPNKQENISSNPINQTPSEPQATQTAHSKPHPNQEIEPEVSDFSFSNELTLAGNSLIDHPENLKKLEQTQEHLKAHPNDWVIITVQGEEGNSLFELIGAGELAGKTLFEAGIPMTSVFIKAIYDSNVPKLKLDIISDPFLKSRGIVNPVNAPLCYKVQIVSLQKDYRGPLLEKHSWPMVEKSFNGKYYRYTLGAVDNYFEAKMLQNKIRKEGAPDAYIVPYIHGFRMNKLQVKKYLESYPDLKNYLAGK